MTEYSLIGSDVLHALQEQTLLNELGRQRDGLRDSHSQSSRLHFSTLYDRSNKITSDRGSRLPASWIFKEDAYINWKGDSNSTKMLCLRGPRGHGKSIAMISIQKEILGSQPYKDDVLLSHFFFKKGEQEMQYTRTALESILYQLLNSNQVRKDPAVVLDVIQILNPTFGEGAPGVEVTRADLGDIGTLCDVIRLIALAIPGRTYLMLDALDECLDRQEQGLVHHLRSLVLSTEGTSLRLVISVRDNIDIESELTEADTHNKRRGSMVPLEPVVPGCLRFIDATSEKNAIDLRQYLMHDVGEVLKRQIDQHKYTKVFSLKLSKIVDKIHEKANGDFTLARMVIANLQQPSRDSFDRRITRLPSAIGEIYMASLESLTPDEQEFVVTALRWTVWTVSSINVLEISDHYREVYKNSLLRPGAESNGQMPQTDPNPGEEGPVYDHPNEWPETKEIIYHIENAGRDFFRLNKTTGIVSVDISIREWIQEDCISGPKSTIKGSRGFNKFRDNDGNTVFNFVLTRKRCDLKILVR
ncbi:hypothetical protein ABW20_dc0102316 [Dactylellina cionopaga]|nr:hypothetical protein ABW20_dc0102316 [Dactylellina cionopaga]